MTRTTAQDRPFPEVDGVTHRFVQAGDVRLHVAEAGAGEPILLLHSFPQHWYAWREVVPLLAADHRVLCPDFRGAGWSDAPATGYDTATRVDDLLALLDSLGLARVSVLSHGWGAWTAFALCLRAPERVGRHLALNMVHPWPDRRAMRTQAWRFWHTALWEYPVLGAAVLRRWPGLTRWLLRRWGATSAAAVAEFADASGLPANARAGQALNWQFVLHDLPRLRRNRALRLTVPTEILLGGRDVLVPQAFLRGGERHADDLTVRVLADCGHLIPEQRPDLVAAAARALFAAS
ncbi:alpha/beta hydrolase [Solihabitans fulvus]|uniref:Alpha/beta hydrolase n=1 Tax=Solihabitans fulvus TaxID=1892852 RepID=A0A5B2WKJ0_9PSEU|nr:alpha/beta hydrolase [Solihabitans fulvus]KAA2251448.1 alpha/beta hydrolase [Solihabitans fulvus]